MIGPFIGGALASPCTNFGPHFPLCNEGALFMRRCGGTHMLPWRAFKARHECWAHPVSLAMQAVPAALPGSGIPRHLRNLHERLRRARDAASIAEGQKGAARCVCGGFPVHSENMVLSGRPDTPSASSHATRGRGDGQRGRQGGSRPAGRQGGPRGYAAALCPQLP